MAKKSAVTLIDPETGAQLCDNRSRVWSLIIYPGDSAPENWMTILDEMICPIAVSPLHTEELKADGTFEKDHRHVILNFCGVKSYDQVRILTRALGGTVPQPVIDIRSYTRYLIHLDQPDKKQYDRSDIITFCDYDLETCLLPSKGYLMKLTAAMIEFISEKNFTEFWDFAYYCKENDQAWFDVLMNEKSSFFDKLLRSRRNKIREAESYEAAKPSAVAKPADEKEV